MRSRPRFAGVGHESRPHRDFAGKDCFNPGFDDLFGAFFALFEVLFHELDPLLGSGNHLFKTLKALFKTAFFQLADFSFELGFFVFIGTFPVAVDQRNHFLVPGIFVLFIFFSNLAHFSGKLLGIVPLKLLHFSALIFGQLGKDPPYQGVAPAAAPVGHAALGR